MGGGLPGIPNLSLVQSAIARPYSGYYRKIEDKAAALTESIARNHGFADGNKRTTLILLYMFVEKSGYEFSPKDNEDLNQAVEEMILSVADRHRSFAEIAAWFRANIQEKSKSL